MLCVGIGITNEEKSIEQLLSSRSNMAKKTQSASKRYKKSFQLAKNAISLGSSV
jgi:hypothetical protein